VNTAQQEQALMVHTEPVWVTALRKSLIRFDTFMAGSALLL
jgi:hypothetical protein